MRPWRPSAADRWGQHDHRARLRLGRDGAKRKMREAQRVHHLFGRQDRSRRLRLSGRDQARRRRHQFPMRCRQYRDNPDPDSNYDAHAGNRRRCHGRWSAHTTNGGRASALHRRPEHRQRLPLCCSVDGPAWRQMHPAHRPRCGLSRRAEHRADRLQLRCAAEAHRKWILRPAVAERNQADFQGGNLQAGR